jgi:hypothetical protein
MKVFWNGKGQSLFEILVALVLVSIFLVTAYYVLNANQILSLQSSFFERALNLANNEIEKLKDLSKTNFSSITNSTSSYENFLIERNVTDLDSYTKKVEIKVSWEKPKAKSVSLISYLVDWKNIPIDDGSGGAGGGGGGGLSGDWRFPTTLSSIDLGPGNAGTDINVKFSTVFISSVAADEKKPDLFLIDVTNPRNPFIKSSLNTGKGINSLSVKQNYAYLAHNSNSQQLQIVNISNESSPYLVSSTTLPNNNTIPLSIFAFTLPSGQGNYLAITTQRSSGNEVFIYDVSNPNSPILLSSLNFDADINDVFVLKDRLYLSSNKIYIYNISNPSSPSLLSNLTLPGNDIGYSLFPLSYNLLLVGGSRKLYFIDTSNLNNLNIISTYDAGGKINDIYARENLAFLATSNPNTEFQIVDYSNINSPYLYSSYNFPQEATGIDYRNNLVFVSVRSNDALRIITSR